MMAIRSAFAVTILLLMSARPAWADEPPPLAEALTGDAKSEYESGKLLFGAGDFGGALIKFTSAHEKSHDPRLYWNMAACEKSLHHYARSLALVRAFAADTSGLVSADERAEAVELVKVMEPLTARLRVRVSEAGAAVTLDDTPIGESPIDAPIVVDLGTRKLRAHKSGYEDATKNVSVSDSTHETEVALVLNKIVHEGRVVIRAGPSDTIVIDGVTRGTGDWSGALSSGGHTLRVVAPSMRPYQTEILVTDNQTREIAVTLEAEPTKIPLWAWIGGGALVTSGLAVGGYFLLKPDPKYDGPKGNLVPFIINASLPVRIP